MSDVAIIVSELSKSYGPDRLSFDVPRGVISGFLGPNGSGKTTTMRILMGLARLSGGRASVLGVPVGSGHEIFRKVAFVPEVKELYPMARVEEMIRLTRGFFPEFDDGLARQLLEEWQLPERKLCQHLSKGMKTKLWLLLAICRRPELLVLDEPTEGLDPSSIERTLQLLVEMVYDRNATVFFSSHQLPEVEQIADHIVMIKNGRTVLNGDIDEVKSRYHFVRLKLEEEQAQIPAELSDLRRDGRILSGFSDLDIVALDSRLQGSGISVLDSQGVSLKEIFLHKVKAS